MRITNKLVLAALAATAMLALAVGTAGARNLRVSEKNVDIKWASLEFSAAGTVTRCPVTLLGSFEESTIAKTFDSKIGQIRHGEVNNAACTGGTATILQESLPWEIRYESFAGTLPRITSLTINLIGARFRVHPTGSAECLAGTTVEHPAGGIVTVSNGVVTGLQADRTRRIPLGGGFICSLGGEAFFEGTGSVTNLPGTASVTVTLI